MIVERRYAGEMLCLLPGGDMCAGDSCMAWRWFDPPEREISLESSEGFGRPVLEDGTFSTDRRLTERTSKSLLRYSMPDERRGYCGLAGKPGPHADKRTLFPDEEA